MSGNVPELRVSTVKRTVVLRGGRSRMRWSPSGNTSLSLWRCTRTRSACPVSLRNVTGIAPFSAVSVIVLSTAGTCRRLTNSLTSASIFASSARARARPPGPDHTDDSDTSSDRLPGSATGFGGGTRALNASSWVSASRYARSVTGAGGTGDGASSRSTGALPLVAGGTVPMRSSTVTGSSSGWSDVSPASADSRSALLAFQSSGSRTTTPRRTFGCSSATTDSPARNRWARSAGGSSPSRRRCRPASDPTAVVVPG